jgi:hypothetical protein
MTQDFGTIGVVRSIGVPMIPKNREISGIHSFSGLVLSVF